MLMFISPLTPLHVGTGRSGGVVDLPVQRDVLGFPMIYASSLKGALKSHAYLKGKKELARALFGPEPDEKDEDKYLAPVSLTDAYPLLIPARSAKGNPVMVTSPFLIRTCLGFVDLATTVHDNKKEGTTELTKLKNLLTSLANCVPESGEAAVFSDKPVINDVSGGRAIIINGDLLKVSEVIDAGKVSGFDYLSNALPEAFKDAVPDRVIILNDDDALRLIERSLIRLTRVRLDKERKVVLKGGLWTEEYLPHGALLISAILYSEVRAKNASKGFNGKLGINKVKEALQIKGSCGYVVLGGKESVGKGVTKVCFID